VKTLLHRLALTLLAFAHTARTDPAPMDAPGPGTAATTAAAGCLAAGDAYLRARVRGAIDADLDWRGATLECEGMPRPGGSGVRARFRGQLPDGRTLALLFAAGTLAPGETRDDVPVNVTVLVEDAGLVYGTQGSDKCRLDRVVQQELPSPATGTRRFRIEGRGFCLAPARAPYGSATVLINRFDFVGRVDVQPEQDDGVASP
jgi:hypothetical protein